jgi:hypothetical protein
VHPLSQLLLHLYELSAYAVTSALPLEQEVALAGLTADERETQEVEGFRLADPALRARVGRETAKLDQAGLFRMQRQRELRHPRTHRIAKAPGVSFVFVH